MVDFGSGPGRSDSATAGVARLRRGLPRARTPAWAERRRLWMDTNYTSRMSARLFRNAGVFQELLDLSDDTACSNMILA